MTDYTDIAVTNADYVTTVEIQRPPTNFFDHSLIGQIADAFAAADEDPNCRAILLASQGKHFCAGANFGTGKGDNSGSRDFTEEGFRNTTAADSDSCTPSAALSSRVVSSFSRDSTSCVTSY